MYRPISGRNIIGSDRYLIVELDNDNLYGLIEFNQRVDSNGAHCDSYISRICWSEGVDYWGNERRNVVAKAFGSLRRAEDWLLDTIENPSFFLLSNLSS